MQKANHIVSFFNGSHYWGGQLKITASAEKITCGLKKNYELRWYTLILLALSVLLHQLALNILIACSDARKVMAGFSTVNTDVVAIVQDDSFWLWVEWAMAVACPFVDTIAECEGRSVTLADCMLQFLAAACKLSLLDAKDTDDMAHACIVVDKCILKMATPIHCLALFLHPLYCKLAVVNIPGFTLRDLKRTALMIAKEKWGWGE
ncbi:DUF659 domain-containing protein [Mycena sanguinolenta]|uniref:DUF659 domain-containing protein n=1 Tax=Mycena sanguinolenta TaxID=230812 RepID=A0A8H6YFC9_9AGAR|nr:DUF659 domain-containing protein [Mycena sanguinolenta]